jgi:hypothetical protein
MKRKVGEVRTGPKTVVHRVKIEHEPSQRGWPQRQALYRLWESLGSNLSMLDCALNTPDRINIYHSGSAWIVEVEATVEE